LPQVTRIAALPHRGDDRVDLEHRAFTRHGVGAPIQLEDRRAAGVGDLLLVIESRRLAVVDPFERHAGDIGAQHRLVQ